MNYRLLSACWELHFTHPVTEKKTIIAAKVPGNIGRDLIRAKIIPELYTGANVLIAQKWERVEFTYVAPFVSPKLKKGERLELVFEGLDTAATVILNGKKIAFPENMFIPHTIDITEHLAWNKRNTLKVTIHSVIDYASKRARLWGIEGFAYNQFPSYENIFVRKAQHMFGWDIAPRILFGGLWRPVKLHVRTANEIIPEDFYCAVRSVDIERSLAQVEISYGLLLDQKNNWNDYEIHIRGKCENSIFSYSLPVHFTHGKTSFTVTNAKLWWPAGYGNSNLYDVLLSLHYQGNIIDEYKTRIGLRTVNLDFHTDLSNINNNRFCIVVNGKNIFVKGSNWVPADAMHDCDGERINKILPMFTDTHCNMVRCWGGNVYEDHSFFNYCDENGLMVWQDFMFGCARYPQNNQFLEQVSNEARTIIRSLRNHPSLALWAGDNETDATYIWANPGYTLPSANKISRQVLKEAVEYHDPCRPYLPSSPYLTDHVYTTQMQDFTPEQHLWGPRGYFKNDFYAKNNAVFASEIGYHGMPSKKSMEQFLSKDKVWGTYNNNEWILHASSPQEKEEAPLGQRNYLMLNQVRELFGESVDVSAIDEFILASQITQAEAKKYFIEHFRTRKPYKTGIIWWNMIDCWPQFSDSVVDYYFEKKLAYEYIKRSQEPLCVMAAEINGNIEIIAVNDTLDPVKGEWQIENNGMIEMKGTFAIAANSHARLETLEKNTSAVLHIIKWVHKGKLFRNHYVQAAAPLDFGWYCERMKNILSD